jgi:hypothetical protein
MMNKIAVALISATVSSQVIEMPLEVKETMGLSRTEHFLQGKPDMGRRLKRSHGFSVGIQNRANLQYFGTVYIGSHR